VLASEEDQPESVDEELVVAAQAGRTEALACLVGRYEPRLLRFLYHKWAMRRWRRT
jgi:hypothetical protein